MSTTALRIIQLVKSLPPSDQRAVSAALAQMNIPVASNKSVSAKSFGPEDYVGLSDDDPFFKVMDEIEQERHAQMGPPPPTID